MISTLLTTVALTLAVASGPDPITPLAPMSAQQKSAAMRPLVRVATECIANSVADDPRLASGRASLGDLVVDSIPSCVNPVRNMIEAYERYYGAGSGEAFFMGPYLDIFPRAVGEWIKKPSDERGGTPPRP